MALVSTNPATGRQIATYREHSRGDIERAVARADTAQQRWAALPAARRARLFRSLGRELLAQCAALAALMTAEMGKPISQARAEVEKSVLLCDYLATHAARLLADRDEGIVNFSNGSGTKKRVRLTHEPLGTILAIMPWNFPLWQVIRAAGPTIAAGNAVLLKHAPNVAGCALALERVFRRAGFPTGVFQALLTRATAVPALLADRRVRGVTLTGSSAAGKSVAALAGAAMKPGVFELGGSDPAIILADADIALAAEKCAYSRLMNSGQSCVCAKRFIVVRSVRKQFEAALVARLAARRMGDPTDPATQIGPLARADLRDRLHAQVRGSVRRGARLLLGGKPLPGPGFFYPPTLLTDVRAGMPVHDEEVFGPVGAIIAVRDEAEAVRVANQSPFGLGAAIFTRSRASARRLVPQLAAGAVFINDFVRSAPELPFGGVKDSGFGRELGEAGLKAFTNLKTVAGE